ncbi:MAG TPA: c-type cytochrome [Thiobacillus sp.]|nr:c-type cytochrome [Thiobacillus sp.]HQT70915.1 c-type cytochrome [Thiobacillus sp.]
MKVKLTRLIMTLSMAMPMQQAHAEVTGAALAQQGAPGVPACLSCHGARGEGLAATGFPRLAGQSTAYLEKQLRAFAGGQRVSPQMQAIASALDDSQIRAVAAYYGKLPGWQAAPSANPAAAAPEPWTRGQKLAIRGNWDKEIPACFACHGPAGEGIAPHFPALSGQPAAYTRSQLKAWQSGTRSNDPHGLMKSVALRMSPAEIDAVSAYLANPLPLSPEER